MGDWNVDIGFNTEELKEATAGAGAGGAGAGAGSGFAKAIKTGLLATGIIGLLLKLKVILEVIGFVLAFISSVLGLLLVKFLDWFNLAVGSERDQVKASIQLRNSLTDVKEGIINALIMVANAFLPKSLEFERVELPRIQEEIVLEAFDELQKVKADISRGISGVEELTKAQRDYEIAFSTVLTTEEFEAIKALKEMNNATFKETLQILDSSGQDINTSIDKSTEIIKNNANSAFSSISSMLNYLEAKARSITGDNLRKEGPLIQFDKSGTTSNVASILRNKFNQANNFEGNPLADIFRGR